MDRERLARRNSILMVLEGTLFWAGLAFMQGDTVIAKFIDINTGSVALAGLAASMRSVMFLVGQFVAGMFIHRIRVQSKYLRIIGFIDRPLMLLMVPILLSGVDGTPAAVLFIVLYTLFFFLDGMLSLAWTEICTRTLPLRQRGVVMSLNQMFSGILGIVIAEILRLILGNDWSMQQKYALIFGLSGVILTINSFVLSSFRDIEHPCEPERPVPNLIRYVKDLIPLFTENRSVKLLLITRMLYLLTLISAPINFLFATSVAGFTLEQQTTLVFMPFIGQIIAGILWAQVSRKLSYPVLMLMGQGIGILCAGLNITCFFLARAGYPVLLPLSIAMVLVSLNASAYVGFSQHLIAIVNEERRPQYLVMSALVLAPFSFGTYIAGLIVEHFGYMPVYLIMLLCGAAGFAMVYRFFISKNSPLPEAHRA